MPQWRVCLQGDFFQWVDVFDHFDAWFEENVMPRQDLALEAVPAEGAPAFPLATCLQILRVSSLLLDNCSNKQLYGSVEVRALLWAARAGRTPADASFTSAAPHDAAGSG